MNKIIAFSLWGINPKYLQGALKNAEIAKEVYPDYKLRYYVDVITPEVINYRLSKFENVEIARTQKIGNWEDLFLRHYPIDEGFDVVLCRDADSRLNYREKSAVDEWLESDKGVLILKDHPYHKCARIMPGLLGVKKGAIKEMKQKIKKFHKTNQYGTDYIFFNSLYEEIKDNCLIYDEFSGERAYPKKRSLEDFSYFVGEVFDPYDNHNKEHRNILIKEEGNKNDLSKM